MRAPSANAGLRRTKPDGCGACAHAASEAMEKSAMTCRIFAIMRCTETCAAQRPGARPAFLRLRHDHVTNGREGPYGDGLQANDREAGQAAELSALQHGEDRRQRAVPPLPLQA